MKTMYRKFLAAGLLAGALTFVGCKSDKSAEGSGDVSKTKQSDDNLRTPEEDPLRTPEPESIREAESEDERGVHDDNAGTGGSGFGNEADDDALNEGGNVDDTTRIPDSPADTTPEDNMSNESQLPEGTR